MRLQNVITKKRVWGKVDYDSQQVGFWFESQGLLYSEQEVKKDKITFNKKKHWLLLKSNVEHRNKISFDKIKLLNKVLRLWPANLGLGFHCDDSDCRTPGDEIKNSGFNRLNCFLCDYDICMACANRKICEKQRGLCCLLLKMLKY